MKYGREVTITIPCASILLNAWQRMHWAKRKKYSEQVCLMIKSALNAERYSAGEPMQKCKIEVDRYSSGTADWDGVMGGLKPFLDCLVVRASKNPHGLGVIEDDNPSCIIECPTVRQHKAKRNAAATVITITEILEV